VSSNPDVPPDICSGDCGDGAETPPPPAPDYCSVFPGAPGCGPSITSVSFAGYASSPTVTVTGTGFGASPPAGSDNSVTACGEYTNNGSDYGTEFGFTDNTEYPPDPPWQAGYGTPPNGSCIGIRVQSWSDTSVVFDFGGLGAAYDSFDHWFLTNGDSFTLVLKGTSFTGTVGGLSVIGTVRRRAD
jgi:hypothetical protein